MIEAISENENIFNNTDRFGGVSGLLKVDGDPVIISSQPIIYSDEELPIIGNLVCGRYIDSIEIAKLCEYSYQNIRIIDYENSPMGLHEGVNIVRQEQDTISGLIILKDINNDPVFVLEEY